MPVTLRRSGRPLEGKPAQLWDGVPVPIDRFGTDHWHMLAAYQPGVNLAFRTHWTHGPTLLRDCELHGHTDIEVWDDLIVAGLIAEDGQLTLLGEGTRRRLLRALQQGWNYVNFRHVDDADSDAWVRRAS